MFDCIGFLFIFASREPFHHTCYMFSRLVRDVSVGFVYASLP